MNKLALKLYAEKLEELLIKYEVLDVEAKLLHNALSTLIDESKNGKIADAIDRRTIPGGYFFDEGSLSKHSGLEDAYAKFVIALSYGELFGIP